MSYESVDQLQRALAEGVFGYASDRKKAAGRALGTIVEIVVFYLLKAWGLERFVAIERPLPEYPRGDITHNVEYSLHPSLPLGKVVFQPSDLPISCAKLVRRLHAECGGAEGTPKGQHLLGRDGVLRNACTVVEGADRFTVCLVDSVGAEIVVVAHSLYSRPFALVECKRVGVEEGMSKGPQTIEKAKQGAYVATSVSSLQKVRAPDGTQAGVMYMPDGALVSKPYVQFLDDVVASDDKDLLRQFILTVGVVSNHGNWFTSENHNKELKVLAGAYDWLLFLTDNGLSQFVTDLLVEPTDEFMPVRDAFRRSYTGRAGSNQFTKVRMNLEADALLQAYFERNAEAMGGWFNVIAPQGRPVSALRSELHILAGKNWDEIHA